MLPFGAWEYFKQLGFETKFDAPEASMIPKFVQHDNVLFLLPEDRELQFPAVAVIQAFVNQYARKMEVNNPYPDKMTFQLHYDVIGPLGAWDYFKQLGLEIVQPPERLDNTSMLVDLREAKLRGFQDSGKHVCQLFGLMCGIETPQYPVIKKIVPNPEGKWGVYFTMELDSILARIDGGGIKFEILQSPDLEGYKGVIGNAGWLTYQAASQGLPVVEIVPSLRHPRWLSKWSSKMYRVVRDGTEDMPGQVERAILSLEEVLNAIKQQPDETATESGREL